MVPLAVAVFFVVAIASHQVGQLFARLKLPLITGYLVTGILVGPFVLGIVPAEAPNHLRFIDELSLAVIAFLAGSELYLKELHSRLKPILLITAGLVLATFSLGSVAVFLLARFIPFMRDMPTTGQIAVSILAGAILVARSPSSAIAIVNELRARGTFTKTVLGVTIFMDVVVIVFFALNSSTADALLSGVGFDLEFVVLLAVELLLSVLAGGAVGMILRATLSSSLHSWLKTALALLTGFAVFVLSAALRTFTHNSLGLEILLEPLLICMIGSFYVTNYTRCRQEFLSVLHNVSPAIYVLFFTLTGASLGLDTLATVWPLALAVFGVRLMGIFVGSFFGGMAAGDPIRYNQIAWMAFITQAGVGIGLAKEVAVEFPAWGSDFATLVISVIVINQLVGPPFFKLAITRLGESHLPGRARLDEIRNAVILGIDGQSPTLARQLKAQNWEVVMADTDASHVASLETRDVEAKLIPDVNEQTLSGLLARGTDALVALLDNDEDNYRACLLAYEEFGIPRLVVRLNDASWANKLMALGALVVDPASAMVHLLDQAVRAPHAAELLLHTDPESDVSQVTITDPDVANMHLRDLRLPDDVVVLCVMRGKQALVPHGYVDLHLNDEIVLVGKPESLEQVAQRVGF